MIAERSQIEEEIANKKFEAAPDLHKPKSPESKNRNSLNSINSTAKKRTSTSGTKVRPISSVINRKTTPNKTAQKAQKADMGKETKE